MQQGQIHSLLTSTSQGPAERKADLVASLVGGKSSGRTGLTPASGTISLRSPGQDTLCLCASVSPAKQFFSLHHSWCFTYSHGSVKTFSCFCVILAMTAVKSPAYP